jgi:hypothetical protein
VPDLSLLDMLETPVGLGKATLRVIVSFDNPL